MPTDPASAETTVQVVETILTLNPIPNQPIRIREVITFTGRLTAGGSGVSGVSVNIRMETGGIQVGSGNTDANGNYTISYTVPLSQDGVQLPCTTQNYRAEAAGYGVSAYQSVTYNYRARIRAFTALTPVAPNNVFSMNGYLEYESATWTPLAARTVTLTVRNAAGSIVWGPTNVTTESDGRFAGTCPGLSATGTYTARAEFGGLAAEHIDMAEAILEFLIPGPGVLPYIPAELMVLLLALAALTGLTVGSQMQT